MKDKSFRDWFLDGFREKPKKQESKEQLELRLKQQSWGFMVIFMLMGFLILMFVLPSIKSLLPHFIRIPLGISLILTLVFGLFFCMLKIDYYQYLIDMKEEQPQ